MNRADSLQQIAVRSEPWDIAVIGGGATGLGIAVDAATRGYAVVLLEERDFGSGTSSRSTKLVHGGVRYLQQGQIGLVRESLKERGYLRRNAPHLVHDLDFIVPAYRWWEKPFYAAGMKVYDALSGKYSFGASKILSRVKTLARIPTLQSRGLRGGVKYHDGQFDDARLAITLARTAAASGGCVLNYARVTSLSKDRAGKVTGLAFCDEETGTHHPIAARCVINATGVFCDELCRADDPESAPLIAASQGAHIVLSRDFLPGTAALMVPRTPDGRVMFAIPWHDHVVVGTTDTPIADAPRDPRPLEAEIDFILETASAYLAKAPTRADVLSVFAGTRPLVRAARVKNTAKLSRSHLLQRSPSGLLTITGGKWTTYRRMAEDAVNQAVEHAGLPPAPCVTRTLHLHGHPEGSAISEPLEVYGSEASAVLYLAQEKPDFAQPIHPDFPLIAAQVVWAARHEMARTVEDVLARRTRLLFLNQKAALAAAPRVASILAEELGRTAEWQQQQLAAFERVAATFSATPRD